MFLNLEIIKQGFFNKINYNWKEKLIRNIYQTGFFPHKKNTHYFVARTSQMGGASQISYTSKTV